MKKVCQKDQAAAFDFFTTLTPSAKRWPCSRARQRGCLKAMNLTIGPVAQAAKSRGPLRYGRAELLAAPGRGRCPV